MAVKISGDNIGLSGTDDDLLTVADQLLTVAGEISVTTLDIGGTNVSATAAELNYVDTTAGVSAASKAIICDSNGDFEMQDGDKVFLGTDADASLYHDGSNCYLKNGTGAMKIADQTSGIAVSIGHTTSETTVNDNLTVTGDLTVNGTTTTVNSTTIAITSSFTFEGYADGNETTLRALNPVADSTIYMGALATGSYYMPLIGDAPTAAAAAVTAAEFALLDGGSTVATVTVADGDGVLFNDAGTMKHVTVQSLSAYFDDEITAMPNLVQTSALNAGSITSGFGNIDNGTSTLDTGAATVASVVCTAAGTFGGGYGSTGATISTAGVIQANGNIETAGSFVIGSADMSETDLEKLDGITNGTAAASKAVVLDGSKNIATIGTLGCGAITSTGNSAMAQLTTSGRVIVDDTTAATTTTDGSLQTDGGLSVAADAVIGDDLMLLSDASVIHFGAAKDVTMTHVSGSGVTFTNTLGADTALGAKPMVLELATKELVITDGDKVGAINFKAAAESSGTDAILVCAGIEAVAADTFAADNNATSLVFKTAASEAAAGKVMIHPNGHLMPYSDDLCALGQSNNNWADLYLADSAVANFGDDQDVTLTHVHNTGLLLNSTNRIQFNDSTQYIGAVDDAANLTIAATTDVNIEATTLDCNAALDVSGVATLASLVCTAAATFGGGLGASGATITTNGAISADGRIITDDTTAATSTTDGSLQTDGGLSVALDAVVGDDLILLSDSSVIHLGAAKDITMTHVSGSGVTFTNTLGADTALGAKPMVLELATKELVIAAGDKIGAINFKAAAESSGTDAILVCAGIEAVSEGTFASDNNAAGLVFKTGASEAAAGKVTITSAGHLQPYSNNLCGLGTTSYKWADLFLASGSVINFNSGNVTMTHSADTLSLNAGASMKATSFVTYSDERMKENINTLDNALDTVSKLRGVSYDWKQGGKSDIGFIAQEVQKVVPSLVHGSEKDGYAMDYPSMNAIIVEAMKQQQVQINDLKKVIESLRK